jgi:hypothetical protein
MLSILKRMAETEVRRNLRKRITARNSMLPHALQHIVLCYLERNINSDGDPVPPKSS